MNPGAVSHVRAGGFAGVPARISDRYHGRRGCRELREGVAVLESLLVGAGIVCAWGLAVLAVAWLDGWEGF